MNNKRYINPSGFPENLPVEQLVEDDLKKKMQAIAESYGYSHLETASVEYMETLASKGDVDKEIYTIGRALGEGTHEESQRGLHFDLTIPFARYVAQHQNDLPFPYRRFQIQKVWRGERPQKGRFREFYQADVDVVARENLPIAFDAEIALVMGSALDAMDIGSITMHISNRKFLSGLLMSLEIANISDCLRLIDKLDKLGEAAVSEMLHQEAGVSAATAARLFGIVSTKIPAAAVSDFLNTIEFKNELLDEGAAELRQIFEILAVGSVLTNVSFVFNPSIARGLDYYTGTVYETTLDGLESYGSICSGGSYSDLASRFTNQKLPGVGMSLGLTRLLSILKEENLKKFDNQTKSDVLVCLLDDQQLLVSLQIAASLRRESLNVEVNYKPAIGLGKQLEQGSAKGIGYALVCELDGQLTLFDLHTNEKVTFSGFEALSQHLNAKKQS